MQAATNRRVPWVDSVKGVAMISVVLSHVANGFRNAGLFANSGGGGLLYTIENITSIYQMPLFCLISGFLFCFAYVTKTGELKREKVDGQILNFVALYVLWSFITWAVKMVFRSEINRNTQLGDILLIWCKPIDVLWYLYVLAAIYTVFRFDKIKNVPGKVLLVIMTLVGISGSVLNGDFLGGLFCINTTLYYSFIFYIGMFLAKRLQRDEALKKSETIAILSVGVISVGLVALFWSNEVKLNQMPVVNLITALGISFLIILLFMRVDFLQNLKILRYIGQHSIEIYVIHVFCTAGVRPIIRRLGISNLYISITVTFMLSVAIPLLIGQISKRLGMYDWVFKPYFAIKRLKDIKNSNTAR